MPAHDIAVLVGSLRRESYSGRVASALRRLAPETMSFLQVQIADLPLYNPDLEDRPPREWIRLREEIRSASGVLIVTPEYNRSFPGGLKNAFDVGSRPYGENVWLQKPAAVVSHSPGMIGGFGANLATRQVLAGVGMLALPQPEVFLAQVDRIFDAGGGLEAGAKALFGNFLKSFAGWVDQHATRS